MSARVLAWPTRPRADGIRNAAALVAPPLAAFVLGWAMLVAASIHAGTGWPGAGDLERGDAHNYLSIAQHGYTAFYCKTSCYPGLPPGWWGNSGWFPLYPLLIAPFAHLGVPAATAGALLAALCWLAALVLLWVRFARPCGPVVGAAVLATAALFPGAVYLYAIFPLSLLAFLSLLGIALLWERRWLAGGIVAALAATTYPLGLLLPVAAAVWTIAIPGRPRERIRRTALVAAPPAVALGAFVLAQRLMTGHWDAFLKIHDHPGHYWQSPLVPLRRGKEETLSFLHHPARTELVPSVQMMIVVALVAAACAGLAISRRRADLLVVAFVVPCWLVPLMISDSNNYRNDAAPLPALLLTRRLPAAIQYLLLAVVAVPAFLLATLFFEVRLE